MNNKTQSGTALALQFIGQFTNYLYEELHELQVQLNQIPSEVMSLAQQINATLEKHSQEAEESLEKVYFSGDHGKKELFDAIQQQVDGVFETALNHNGIPAQVSTGADISETKTDSESVEELESRFRRFGGLFSKHMESLSTIGLALNQPLVELMGILSNDDIMTQKFSHTRASLLLLSKFIELTQTLIEKKCVDKGTCRGFTRTTNK